MPSNNPSGVTTIHSPPSSREISVSTCSPVVVSQRKVLPSSLAEASSFPSGLKSIEFDAGYVSGQRSQLPLGADVPNLDRVVGAG